MVTKIAVNFRWEEQGNNTTQTEIAKKVPKGDNRLNIEKRLQKKWL